MFPQLAKEAEITTLQTFIENDEWVMEQKLDGHRLLLCSPGGDFPPTALTRGGSPYTRKLPKALQDFRFPADNKPMEFVLDGELVGGTFYVFDLPVMPMLSGHDYSTLDLETRRLALETFVKHQETPFVLVPQARTREEKIALSDKALGNNFEGLLLKRKSSKYRPGARCEDWLKVKFVTTADCIVLDVRDDGKESVRLGMVEADNPAAAPNTTYKLVDVGRASLIGKEKNGAISKGDVIEVRYLYAGAGGRLYQPTILRKRDDKLMHECTTDQMKWVNKEVALTL